MKYKPLLIMALILLNIAFVRAEGVILKGDNVNDQIRSLEGYATFDLIVVNDDRKDRDIFITFPYSTDWRVNIDPYLLRIPSKGSDKATIQTFSLDDQNVGTFELVLNVKSRDKEINENFPYRVTVIPFNGDEVLTKLVIPERVDPRVTTNIKLKLENLRKSDLEDLEVFIKSGDLFSERRFLDLKAGEIRLEEFSFDFSDKMPEPGNYEVKAEVKYGEKVLGSSKEEFLLAGFTDVVEKVNIEGNFLKKVATVSKINGGTRDKDERIVIKISRFNKMFTTFDKQPDKFSRIEDEYVVEWNFSLGSGETFTVNITTNYTTTFWSLVIVILVLYFAYQMIRKKIVVSKKVISVSKDRDGISGMKVILHLRNRSRRNVQDIRLVDVLPSLIGTSPHSFGTLYPTKVSKTALGNIKLIWHIGDLHKGEERIISYVARSRLSIIGKLILPSAVVSYSQNGKVVKSKSNKLTLLTAITEMGEKEK